MMKRVLACFFAFILATISVTPALAAGTEDAAPMGDQATYSVVSAAVNREYDFVNDFHDSYPYDEDFYTVGVFELDDYNGDVTLTLKNNSTNETFVYEKNDQTEWSVKASVDHLLYETTQLKAQVHIYDLGGDYGIREVDIPVTITVVSSQYSADAQKYPSYDNSYTAMYEGEDFTVEYDPSSPDHKATVKLLKTPWLFSLSIYNVETKEVENHDTQNSVFEFPMEAEVTDFDPSSDSFWFFLPSKLIMEDGYPFGFTMGVHGFRNKKATDDSAEKPAATDAPSVDGSAKDSATADSAATPDSAKTTDKNNGAVQTGDSARTLILAALLLIGGAFILLYSIRRNRAR